MFLVSSCSCHCPIHWSQVLNWEWRCSWGSANRRCSNHIWVINNFIAYWGASYIRDFRVFCLDCCHGNCLWFWCVIADYIGPDFIKITLFLPTWWMRQHRLSLNKAFEFEWVIWCRNLKLGYIASWFEPSGLNHPPCHNGDTWTCSQACCCDIYSKYSDLWPTVTPHHIEA